MANTEQESAAAARLWDWVTRVYGDAAVARACLLVQDAHGVDVVLLLFSAWCASEARALHGDELRLADERCAAWRREVLWPLRATRRRWKIAPPHAGAYAAIKGLELAAERRQLDFLAALFADSLTGAGAHASAGGCSAIDEAPGSSTVARPVDGAALELLDGNLDALSGVLGLERGILRSVGDALRTASGAFHSAAMKPPD